MGSMSSRRQHRDWLLPIVFAVLVAGCGSDKKESVATAPAGSATTPPAANPAPPPVVPVPAVTQASWAPDALEELLAPIALYPDQLLTQILAASVNSQEVLDGGNWLLQNQNLSGDALDNAARTAGFGAAMRSLLQFPPVVDMLCQQIDWTRQVGSAFTSDQKGVLDAVQRLRAQAAEVGNLKSTPEQTVETKVENNQTIVEVKPANPEVVYVPQYNPQVVYTTPPPAAPAPATTTTTTADDPNTVSTGTAVAGGLLAFGAGMLIGNAMDDDDDDYCCYPNWGHSTVVVGARPFYPPAYAYRPAYNSGFRPAYGYNPPAGYGNNYRNRSGNTNVNINNNDYYNRFSNNQNLRARNTQSPLSGATQNRYGQGGTNRSAQTGTNRADSWKGQSSYRGARNDASTARVNEAAGSRVSTGDRKTGSSSMRLADASDARNSFSRDGDTRPTSTNRSMNTDRGYGESPRMPDRDTNVQRPAQADTAQSLPSRQEHSRDSTFSGASARDSGSFERSASARGRASTGGGGRAARGGGRRR